MSAAIRPRRQPRLRVVSPSLDTTRHAGLFRAGGLMYVVEVWTFAEWAKLAEWERPERSGILPGIGFFATRLPAGQTEEGDILDVVAQAWEAHRGE